jgi:adenine-specific DNA-methyltransferase
VSRVNDLIRQVARRDPELAEELRTEVDLLAERRSFGLNFERHVPESVELPGRPVRRGDKVRVLPPRGEKRKKEHDRLWKVVSIVSDDGTAAVTLLDGEETEEETAALEELVVVAEFRDPIYPGLVSTGKVERGGDKPFHTVINAENFHALQALLYTHRGKVDAIYIDPPYNTRDKDWKYNNDYVDSDDLYKHSKWLAMMERRLRLAKDLLDPDDSTLIVTIDEKEYLRLGLLLEELFPESRIQMVSSVISSQASVRDGLFSRCDEYIFFVFQGCAVVEKSRDDMLNEGLSETKSQLWFQFVRTGSGNLRTDSPNLFYPIFVDPQNGRIVEIGSPIGLSVDKSSVEIPDGTIAVWPETADGREARWRTGVDVAQRRVEKGLLRCGKSSRKKSGWSVMTVNQGTEDRIEIGEVLIEGHQDNGAALLRETSGSELRFPKTVWNKTSHNAGWHGSKLLASLLPGSHFPYPKSLYAVEDALRFAIGRKPNAVVLDFFCGSGTTAHAVARLNRQDEGHRRTILVTNNEVGDKEARQMWTDGLRPGDPEWEREGIFESVTQPRIEAAVSGLTSSGKRVEGSYKFTDEFPMADGLKENVEFFDLTYEAPLMVKSHRDFERIAPLLWLRAGSVGRRIEDLSAGWDVAESYGVLSDLDQVEPFLQAVEAGLDVGIAFIVTDDDRLFESIARDLPERVEPLRLYESYLKNFEISTARSAR